MSAEREQQFKELVQEFPDSPMGHFSLGKLYLEERRYDEAVQSLEAAVKLDPEYAAALVSLGDAYVAAGKTAEAKATWEKAVEKALAQKHSGLAGEIEDKLAELE